MLCNTLIQPHYDFAWLYNFIKKETLAQVFSCGFCETPFLQNTAGPLLLNLSMSLKIKLQKTQNSCIRYYLGLKGKNEFEKINWIAVSNMVDQCLAITAYNFKHVLSPKYMGDIYSLRISPNIRTNRSTDISLYLFIKKEIARKSISYLGSKIWNDLNQDTKSSPSAVLNIL